MSSPQKTCLIIGAGDGLGGTIARAFAAEGRAGAARFAAGRGRAGDFLDI